MADIPSPDLLIDETSPSSRREIKRRIISLQTMLRANDMTGDNKRLIEKNIFELRKHTVSFQPKSDKEELEKRRNFVESNPGLKDIFHTMWMVFFKYTNDGYLSKEGYIKFNNAILVSLGGVKSFEDVHVMLENDWSYDKAAFGPFDRQGFFDLLLETIEIWTEVMNPSHFAAFAWALLDSIADTSSHPPKMRPLREIRCITQLENEAVRKLLYIPFSVSSFQSMINSYLKNKRIRSALSIGSEWLARVPEVQKRLQSRKFGSKFTSAEQSMIEAISHTSHSQIINSTSASSEKAEKTDDSYSDSEASSVVEESGGPLRDDEDLKIVGSIIVQDVLRARNDCHNKEQVDSAPFELLKERDDDSQSLPTELSDEDEEVDDSKLNIPFNSEPTIFEQSNVPFHSRRGYLPDRKSTISFMSYVESRRKSRADLNGGYMLRQQSSSFNQPNLQLSQSVETSLVDFSSFKNSQGGAELNQLSASHESADPRENQRKKFAEYMNQSHAIAGLTGKISPRLSSIKRKTEISNIAKHESSSANLRTLIIREDSKTANSVSFEIDSNSDELESSHLQNYQNTISAVGVNGEILLQIEGKPFKANPSLLKKGSSRASFLTGNGLTRSSVASANSNSCEDLQAFLLKLDNADEKDSDNCVDLERSGELSQFSDSDVRTLTRSIKKKKNKQQHQPKTISSMKGKDGKDKYNIHRLQNTKSDHFNRELVVMPSRLLSSPSSSQLLDGPFVSLDIEDFPNATSSATTVSASVSSSLKALKKSKSSHFGEYLPINQSNDPLHPQLVAAMRNSAERIEKTRQFRSQNNNNDDQFLNHLESFLRKGNQLNQQPASQHGHRFSTLIPSREGAIVSKFSNANLEQQLADQSSSSLPSRISTSHSRFVEPAVSASSMLLAPNLIEVKPVQIKARSEHKFSKPLPIPIFQPQTNISPNIVYDRNVTYLSPMRKSIPPHSGTPLHPELSKVETLPLLPELTEKDEKPPSRGVVDSMFTDDGVPVEAVREISGFENYGIPKPSTVDQQSRLSEQKNNNSLSLDVAAITNKSNQNSTQQIHEKYHKVKDIQPSVDLLVSVRRQKYEYSYQFTDAISFQKKNIRNLQIPSRSPISSPNQPSGTFLTIIGSDPQASNLIAATPAVTHPNLSSSSTLYPYTSNPSNANSKADLSYPLERKSIAPLPFFNPSIVSNKSTPWLCRRSASTERKDEANQGFMASYLKREIMKKDNLFNRSNHLDIWRDKLELLKLPNPTDSQLHQASIRKQSHNRQAFEDYVRSL